MREREAEKCQKEQEVEALDKLFKACRLETRRAVGAALGVSASTVSRALDSFYPPITKQTRLKIARYLGRQCKDEQSVRALVEKTGFEMTNEEWRVAQVHLEKNEWELHGVPRHSGRRMLGRTKEIEELQEWVMDGSRNVEPVFVIRGVGGVGKTMLAIHVLEQQEVKEKYRGNIFWIDFRLYGEKDGLRWLAHEVDKEQALKEKDARRVIREALRGKRALVILDGVEEGINLDGWIDLLSSKGRLLVTACGIGVEGSMVCTRELRLGQLDYAAALELLTRDIAVDLDEDSLAWVVDVLGGLPLALCISNAIGRWNGGLGELVNDLRAERLEILQINRQRNRSVRVTFESSYRRLAEGDQRFFRLLGVSLPRFEVKVVAVMAGESERSVRRRLMRLMQVGLVETEGQGVYWMHNLVHDYAVELSQSEEDLGIWQTRYAGYYLEKAQEADAMGDMETMGAYLAEIAHGALCALAAREKDMVKAYLHYTGPYFSLGDNEGLIEDENSTGPDGLLRAARFRLKLGRAKDALRLASKVREEEGQGQTWLEATLIEVDALLALGRLADAAVRLEEQGLWEHLAQLDAGDDLLFQAWTLYRTVQHGALSEGVRASGENLASEKHAAEARARWEAGQASPEWARLQVMRATPLGGNTGEAIRALESRMALAEDLDALDLWLADALRWGSLLVQAGEIARAEMALQAVEAREQTAADERFWPWVLLLQARVAAAMGRDDEAEQVNEAAVEALAAVFGRTVFWEVSQEGETPVEAWRRALQKDDVFRYVEPVSEMYPLFVQLGDDLPDEDEALRAEYAALQEEMGWAGLDLPDWDWVTGEEEAEDTDDSA